MLDNQQMLEERNNLKEKAYKLLKNTRKGDSRIRSAAKEYGYKLREELSHENQKYVLEEIKKLFLKVVMKTGKSLNDFSITEYKTPTRVTEWGKYDEYDETKGYGDKINYYNWLMSFDCYLVWAKTEFEMYSKAIEYLTSERLYFPKVKLRELSIDEYETQKVINDIRSLETEQDIYDRNTKKEEEQLDEI